ncbi:MAG TPA: four helix bundle protein [Dehalococcoidia bacterium]
MESKSAARGFRDLIAWQKADRLASSVYRACKDMPPQQRWLADQVLRCAVSVPANIAEGHGRGTRAEFLRFIDIARGSLSELEYYLHFLEAESLLAPEVIAALDASRIETGRVVFGLWRALKTMSGEHWDHTGAVREEGSLYSTP